MKITNVIFPDTFTVIALLYGGTKIVFHLLREFLLIRNSIKFVYLES